MREKMDDLVRVTYKIFLGKGPEYEEVADGYSYEWTECVRVCAPVEFIDHNPRFNSSHLRCYQTAEYGDLKHVPMSVFAVMVKVSQEDRHYELSVSASCLGEEMDSTDILREPTKLYSLDEKCLPEAIFRTDWRLLECYCNLRCLLFNKYKFNCNCNKEE